MSASSNTYEGDVVVAGGTDLVEGAAGVVVPWSAVGVVMAAVVVVVWSVRWDSRRASTAASSRLWCSIC